jgi:hypothetical protein
MSLLLAPVIVSLVAWGNIIGAIACNDTGNV